MKCAERRRRRKEVVISRFGPTGLDVTRHRTGNYNTGSCHGCSGKVLNKMLLLSELKAKIWKCWCWWGPKDYILVTFRVPERLWPLTFLNIKAEKQSTHNIWKQELFEFFIIAWKSTFFQCFSSLFCHLHETDTRWRSCAHTFYANCHKAGKKKN